MQIVVWENTDRPEGQPAVFTANLATRELCSLGGTAKAAVGGLVRWLKMATDTTNSRVGSVDQVRQYAPMDTGYQLGSDVHSATFPGVYPGGPMDDADARAKAVADPVAFLRSFPAYAEQYDDNGEVDADIKARVSVPPDVPVYAPASAFIVALWSAASAFDFPNLPAGWEVRQFTGDMTKLPGYVAPPAPAESPSSGASPAVGG